MTPFEAAGAILVSFQNNLDALQLTEQQSRGFQTRFGFHTAKFNIIFNRDNFKNNLDHLLGPFIDDANELSNLYEDPEDDKWHALGLDASIKRQFSKNYDSIQSLLELMYVLLKDISHLWGEFELPISGNDSLWKSSAPQCQSYLPIDDPTPNASNIEMSNPGAQSRARIDPLVSPRSQKIRADLFKEFERYNDILKGLLSGSNISQDASVSQTHRKVAGPALRKPIVCFWQNAKKLYEFIDKSWQCKCKPHHNTNILLQHRTDSEVDFNVLFFCSPHDIYDIHNDQRWTWLDIIFKPTKEEPLPRTPPPEMPKKEGLQRIPETDNRLSRRVKGFLGSKLKYQKANKSHSSSPQLAALKRQVGFSDMQRPTNHTNPGNASLCQTFRALCLEYSRVEYCLSNDTPSYTLSPMRRVELGREDQLKSKKSLESLLSSGSLNPRECCFIALTLASSVYQLHSSPWLQSPWDKRNIMFFSSFADSSHVIKNKPFLSCNFLDGEARKHTFPNDRGDCVIESLGIALLELCFGRPLETFATYLEKQGAVPSHFFSRGIARTLIPAAENQMGSGFADSIRWCLDYRKVDANDNNWRRELFYNVVSPLHIIYENMPSLMEGFVSREITHNGDIVVGGVGMYGSPHFHGTVNLGGNHTHVQPSGGSSMEQ